MKKLVLFAVAFAFGVVSYAQKGPQVEFKTETIDYGKVKKSEDNGIRVFEFTNIGDEPLVINEVKSSCGCTVPEKPKEPIMPGKTGEIQVKYNMNPGMINKAVTVESNAVNKDNGRIILRISGEVLREDDAQNSVTPTKNAAPASVKASVLEKKKTLPQS